MVFGFEFFAILGFLFAAYAVVGNDALQTLGTFINSNSKLHWFWLFLFAASILVATFTYGWIIYDGDPSWGRLANTKKYPAVEIQWYHTLPPLALLIITRFGVPVSTSFMVLTVFATVGGLTSMLQKSLIGYGLAFAVGLGVYMLLTPTLEKFFKSSKVGSRAPWGLMSIMGILIAAVLYFFPEMVIGCDPSLLTDAEEIGSCNKNLEKIAVWKHCVPYLVVIGVLLEAIAFVATRKWGKIAYWVILQWVTTGYLWGVWLIQDFANIFIFLPREITAFQGFTAMFAIALLLAYTFWNKGGPVQKILQSKTAVTDIRSATIIDFIYASLLFFFKEVSDIPMSTTFVFLGLIAGREYGFALMEKALSLAKAWRLSISDASKAFIGLAISINMAVGLPLLGKALSEPDFNLANALPDQSFQVFVILVNLLLLPIGYYLLKQESKFRTSVATGFLGTAAAAFFLMPPA